MNSIALLTANPAWLFWLGAAALVAFLLALPRLLGIAAWERGETSVRG